MKIIDKEGEVHLNEPKPKTGPIKRITLPQRTTQRLIQDHRGCPRKKVAYRDEDGWSPKHTKVMFHHIQGLDGREISKRAHIAPQTVYDIIRSDIFKQRLAEFEKKYIEKVVAATADEASKARRVFLENVYNAANKIVQLMKDGQPKQRLQLAAAIEILNQSGLKPVEVIETRHRPYTPEEVANALTVAKELEQVTLRLSTTDTPFLLHQIREKQEPETIPVVEKVVDEGTLVPSQDRQEVSAT